MNDIVSIALLSAGYAGSVGVLGWLLARFLRRRSFLVATVSVAAVAVLALAAGLVGTANAMFISSHDLRVTIEVLIVSGVVAAIFASVIGMGFVRGSRDLQDATRDFGTQGTFAIGGSGSGPAELRALAGELERTSRALNQAHDRERRLEASRRELVAWVSHDLRTPLAGIRAMAEALEDEIAIDPARYHASILREIERMARMVDDLFELSRIQAGAFDLSVSEVALHDLVSEALAGADPIARANGVLLGGSADTGLMVSVDPAGMSRVLLNLLTNAIRHTPYDGAVEVQAIASGDMIEMTVQDSCGGIPEDELARVFDVAWRGSAARSPQASPATGAAAGAASGAGLGLAIVRGIVEAHRGTVEVHNRDGLEGHLGPVGCQFVVRLPIVQPELPNAS